MEHKETRNPEGFAQTAAYPNGFGAEEVEGELPQILEYLDCEERRGNGLECMRLAEVEMVRQLLKVISYPIQGEIKMADFNLYLYD